MDSFRFKMSDHIFKDMIQLSDVEQVVPTATFKIHKKSQGRNWILMRICP